MWGHLIVAVVDPIEPFVVVTTVAVAVTVVER
jgi:hypothetical protein